MDNKKAVVVISGGMDSTVLLHDVLKKGFEVCAMSVNYNQRHKRELLCAKKTCKKLGVTHKIVDLRTVGAQLLSNSCLTSTLAVPEGHYASDSMKLSIVPNRNMILLSLAIGYAVNEKATTVFYGAHSGDHAIYPDCRPEFVSAMKAVALLCDYNPIDISAPYSEIDKGDIANIGVGLGVDFKLTHTCYNGKDIACGVCGACCERLLGFAKHGHIDPIPYKGGWKKALANAKVTLEKGPEGPVGIA